MPIFFDNPKCDECGNYADAILESTPCLSYLKPSEEEGGLEDDTDCGPTTFWEFTAPDFDEDGAVTLRCTDCDNEWQAKIIKETD